MRHLVPSVLRVSRQYRARNAKQPQPLSLPLFFAALRALDATNYFSSRLVSRNAGGCSLWGVRQKSFRIFACGPRDLRESGTRCFPLAGRSGLQGLARIVREVASVAWVRTTR